MLNLNESRRLQIARALDISKEEVKIFDKLITKSRLHEEYIEEEKVIKFNKIKSYE